MTRHFAAGAFATALLVALASMHQQQVSAQSVGFQPSTLEIDEGLRGQAYEVTTVLLNQSDAEKVFQVSQDGETAEWITFASANGDAIPADGINVGPGSEARVIVRIEVPDSAANGAYRGAIRYDEVAKPGDERQGNVVVSLQQPVSIDVTGDQRLDIRVADVSAASVEAGQPLLVNVAMSNRGNVDVRPAFSASIFPESATDRSNPAGTIDATLDRVGPGSSATSAAEWNTASAAPGTYWASYELREEGKRLAAGEFTFELLAPGAVAAAGVVTSLVVIEPVKAGATGRADAVFENRGGSRSTVHFEGQVLSGGVPLTAALSPEGLVVAPGEQATLSAYFDLPQDVSGELELRGRITFEGGATDEASARFTVDGGDGGVSPLIIGGIAAVLVGLVTVGGALVVQRRRTG